MKKICNRCSKEFECNSTSNEKCDCSNLQLQTDTINYLKKTKYDCLCNDCLKELDHYTTLKIKYPFPSSPNDYVEGIHYYIEGRYWVFTNFYHYLKGSCCKNNCRHCAYGYTPE